MLLFGDGDKKDAIGLQGKFNTANFNVCIHNVSLSYGCEYMQFIFFLPQMLAYELKCFVFVCVAPSPILYLFK